MKANRNPLDIIKYIMDAVVIFFGGKVVPISIEEKTFKKGMNPIPFMKDSFDEPGGGKTILSDMQFMKNLKEYAKDSINDETMELLEPYLNS